MKSFARSQTAECRHCSGAGELYELEHPDHGTDWDAGVSLFERVPEVVDELECEITDDPS